MKKILFLVIVGVIIAATIGYYALRGNGDDAAMAMSGERPPQAVSIITLESTDITDSVTLPGRVTAFGQAQIRPQINGIITERLFDEGTHVEKGQQLYKIDDARYVAALNSALADLKSAEANVKSIEAKEKRYAELVKVKAVSQQDYEDAKAGLDQAMASIAVAEAAVDVANVNVGYTNVYAPISGQISKSFATVGTLVNSGQAEYLATITQLDPIYIDIQQSATDVAKIRSDLKSSDKINVTVTPSGTTDPEKALSGELEFSEVTVDPTTGSVSLRAVIPNPDRVILPGEFVKATLNLGTKSELLVPQRATSRTPFGTLQVMVVNDANIVESRTLEEGRAYHDQWIVKSGVKEGDRVIVEGYQKVKAGDTVTPSPWKALDTSTDKKEQE